MTSKWTRGTARALMNIHETSVSGGTRAPRVPPGGPRWHVLCGQGASVKISSGELFGLEDVNCLLDDVWRTRVLGRSVIQ